MSFTEQLSRWVHRAIGPELKRNINRLIDRGLRRLLLDAVRGPVLGSRGEAGLAVTVVPEPPSEQAVEGLYGHPYPGNPHPDPGALWFESAGSWTGLIYPDWQEDFPHPPGVLAGNVFHENTTTGHLVSWHWYPSGGPPGNAVKYLYVPSDFYAWPLEEQQAAVPGGDLSRDILHMGRRLYRLPDHWACIGACTADNWLFMVGWNLSGRGHNWIWSGYDVDTTGTCNAATALAVWVKSNPAAPPDTIFSLGMTVRIDGEERTIQTLVQSGGPDCWLIRLATALSAVPAAGTPVEIIKPGGAFGGYTTRVFAVATTTNVEGDLEVVPGAMLYDIADLLLSTWTQQFVAHPAGRNMMSKISSGSVTINRDIHRLAFNTGVTPPTVNHTIEARVEKKDEIYLDAIDDARIIHDCTRTDTNTRRRDVVHNGQPCFNCPPSSNWYFLYDWVYSGQSVVGYTRDIEDRMGRKINSEYKSHTLAVDYDTNGNELVATLEIDYQSTITVRTQNNWSRTETLNGKLSLDPYCVGSNAQWNNVGQYTDVRHDQSILQMNYRLETDLSVHVSVNGVKKIELGRVQDDFSWSNDPASQSGYWMQTLTYEGSSHQTIFCPPDVPDCDDPDVDQILCKEPGAHSLIDNVIESGGTIVQGPNCDDLPSYDYESFYPPEPIAYDIRNVATPLLFIDLRAGVYVTQGREGIIDDIYGLVETADNPAFSDRQMYPYTVEAANFLPSKPAPQDRGDYDQYWAAWGVDFVSAGAVGSPAPVWLVITQMDKKGPTDLVNPINWRPSDFIDLGGISTVEQGSAQRNGKVLVNVFVELPTAGQETLQAVELRNPAGDPLSLIGIPTATKIANIGAV